MPFTQTLSSCSCYGSCYGFFYVQYELHVHKRNNSHLITYEEVQKMNKTGLTKVVVEKAELIQKDAAAATQALLDTITNALANG